MAKIILISLYEANYLGTRILSSFLNKNGHLTRNLFFKDLREETREYPIENHIGYQYLRNSEIVTLTYEKEIWSNKEEKLLKNYLQKNAPDIIGISARSPLAGLAGKLIKIIKGSAPNALLIAGGYGPTLETEKFLDFGIDVVVRGDGEEALLELANCYDTKGNWRHIKNVAFKSGEKYIINPLSAQVRNIGAYPPPTYSDDICSFIESDKLYENFDPYGKLDSPAASPGVYSTFISRGCVNSCSYCSGGLWAKLYKQDGAQSYKSRKRDLDQVLNELEGIDRKSFSYIYFVDECNTLTTKEIYHFFGEYKKRVGLPFFIYMNYLKVIEHPEILQYVIDAGLDCTGVGVQTGSENFAAKFFTRKNKNSIYLKYLNLLFSSYLSAQIQMIEGHCYEDDETFRENLDFIKLIPFDPLDRFRMRLHIFRLKVFPKAPMVQIAPRVIKEPMTAKEWWRRALLMELRQFGTDEEVEYALSNTEFVKEPALLKRFALDILRRVQINLLEKILNRVKNKEIFFYGIGNQFQKNWKFFKERGIIPKAFLIDTKFINSSPSHIENIPVRAHDQCEEELQNAHTFIFTNNSGAIYRSLINRYSIDRNNISACITTEPLAH